MPVGSEAEIVLPKLNLRNVSVAEGGKPVWTDGKFAAGAEGVLGAAEGTFGVDYPIGAEQRAQKSRERRRRSEMVQCAVKFQLASGVEFAQACHELTAEHAAEDLHRQEEVMPSWNPMAVVWGQAAGRDDAVDMWMVQQLLIPGVQHAEEADLRAQVSGIAGDLEQRLGACAE